MLRDNGFLPFHPKVLAFNVQGEADAILPNLAAEVHSGPSAGNVDANFLYS